MNRAMGIADLMEHAVHETIERFFEDGKVPAGLVRTIENVVDTAVEHAVEEIATAMASSSSLPASSGWTTSRERPRTSRPTGRDDEGHEDWRPHELIFINDKNNKSGVFHHANCHHVVSTTTSYTKCNKCPNPASSRAGPREDEQSEAEDVPQFVLVNPNNKHRVYHKPEPKPEKSCSKVGPCPRTYRKCDQCLKHWPSK